MNRKLAIGTRLLPRFGGRSPQALHKIIAKAVVQHEGEAPQTVYKIQQYDLRYVWYEEDELLNNYSIVLEVEYRPSFLECIFAWWRK